MAIWKWLKTLFRVESFQDVNELATRAHARLVERDWSSARPLLLKLLRYRSQITDEAWINWAIGSLSATFQFEDRYQESIDFFSDYILSYPGDAVAFEARAGALWYAGKLNESLADYSRCLETPHMDKMIDIGVHSSRGQVLVELGEHDKALLDLNRALELLRTALDLDPQWRRCIEAFTRNGRAAALAGRGDFPAADREFESSIQIWPQNAWVYFNRAKAHELQGNLALAVTDYRTALEKSEPPLNVAKKEFARLQLANKP